MTAIVAGLDYSTRALDVALVRGRELVSTHCYDLGRDEASRIAVISRLLAHLQERDVKILVLEKRWLRQGKGIASAMKLHDVAHSVRTQAIERGFEVVDVPINSWRKQVLGKGNLKTDAAKRAAIDYCRNVYRVEVASDNEADAVCLATYGAQMAAQRALVCA